MFYYLSNSILLPNNNIVNGFAKFLFSPDIKQNRSDTSVLYIYGILFNPLEVQEE